MIHKTKPELSLLPEWGQWVFVKQETSGKLDAKAKEGKWVGFSAQSQGHRVYWPNKCSVTVEHNLIFGPDLVHIPFPSIQPQGEKPKDNSRDISKEATNIPLPTSPNLPNPLEDFKRTPDPT